MRTMSFSDAIEDALAEAMAEDPRVIIMGEDVQALRRNLYVLLNKRIQILQRRKRR